MANFAATAGEAFAQRLMEDYIAKSCAMEVTNQDYEGELTAVGDTVNINSIDTADWAIFNGSDFTWDTPTEFPCKMVADQVYAIHFKIGSLDRLKSWIKKPEGTLLQRSADKLKVKVDSDIFALYGDAASGNWIGTSYTTGTVTIAATTGAVTGNGTTFTAAMVGKPFKAAGHTAWYRVKTYTDATHIVIEDDKDDIASAYTGGAIDAGAAYEIQANTALTLTAATVLTNLVAIKTKLDENNVPETGRKVVLPPSVANLIINSSELDKGSLPADVFKALKIKGYIGEYVGLQVYSSNQLSGAASTGFYALGMHTDWMTMGIALNESSVVELEKNFGYGYKGLAVWGRKVADVRRKAGVVLFCKV